LVEKTNLIHSIMSQNSSNFVLETDRYHLFETDIFNFFHRYLASCRYSIGYRYSKIWNISKVFWLKLVRIAYSPDLQ